MMELKAELIKSIIENKQAIFAALLGLIHSSLFYYVRAGRKSLKGYIKFVLTFGKIDESKA